ncbi:MAG: hypothetical protein IH600_00860, partial [Bacteroidetes bacterium]|nr:hypothetical protein [Bacteroidota bacterium]
MRHTLKGLLPFLLVVCFSHPAAAQSRGDDGPPMDRPAIGISGGFISNMHSATFSKLPGIASCCAGYDGGDGSGIGFGAVARFVIDDAWSLQLLLRYADYSATLTSEEEIGPVLTPRGPEAAAVEHRLVSNTTAMDFRPTIGLRPIAGVPLTLFTGPHLSYLISNDVAQTEELLRPADITYDDLQRSRNKYDGALPEAASLYAGFAAGIRYGIMLGERWSLWPEASIRLAATSLSSGVDWMAHGVEGSLALMYH